MITYKQAFEQMYTRALIEYYSGDYVPLITEGFTKTVPQQAFADLEEVLVSAIYELLEEEAKAA